MLKVLLLNPFPTLLDYYLYAPLILRIALGTIFLGWGIVKISPRVSFSLAALPVISENAFLLRLIGAVEVIGALSLIVGFQVQTFAIIFALALLSYIVVKKIKPDSLRHSPTFYWVLLAISLSLTISGPGPYALGLPL